jgi:rhodanese-related sulfurtransferase/DNA-binding transcriptional ArsR family regulator
MDRDRAFKDAIYAQIARVGSAVAHPKRLELLDLLCQGPMTVEELARKADMPVGSASQHLQRLKAARLVALEVEGTRHRYHLTDDGTCLLFRVLRDTAQRYLAEMRETVATFLGDESTLEAVDAETLQERLAGEGVLLLDVRPREEYLAGHIPGALSLPLEELHQRLSELPRDRTVVAYCRGPYCVLSLHAAKALSEAGIKVVRLVDGVADWRALGLPVAVGDHA